MSGGYDEETESAMRAREGRTRLSMVEDELRERALPGGLWAFWRYDLFPYLLGGRVTKSYASGTVKVEGYGDHTFRPKMLLLGKEGEELCDKLKALTAERDDMLKGVEATFRKKLDALLAVKG